jgi:hypothetical protein
VLDKLSGELARETRGGRNDMLNKAAFTMGGFVGSGTIERAEVEATIATPLRIANTLLRIAHSFRLGPRRTLDVRSNISRPLQQR